MKLLMETQEKSYRGSMQVFLDQVLSKMTELSNQVFDLKRSLEFSQQEIDTLKDTVKGLREAKAADRQEITLLQSYNEELRTRINDLDDSSRRNNLRIDGVEETAWETWEQTTIKVKNFLKDQLNLEDVSLEHAQRVGPPRDRRPRTILARFSRLSEREAALRNARKLRGSVFFYEDLCPESQQIKKEKYSDYKKAKSEGKIAYFVRSKLVIRDRDSRDNQGHDGRITGPPVGLPTYSLHHPQESGQPRTLHRTYSPRTLHRTHKYHLQPTFQFPQSPT